MRDLVICSVGVHALEMAEIVERINAIEPTWRLLGFFCESKRADQFPAGTLLNGYHVLGAIDCLNRYPGAALAIGNEFCDAFPMARAATIVDPRSWVSRSARIGRACVVYPHCYIGYNAVLGDRAFVLSGSVINHDVTIEDKVVLASQATLAGAVHVETGCYLGQSCTIRQELRIGKDSLIGMGAVVVKDVPPNSVMIGNPARRLRQRRGGTA